MPKNVLLNCMKHSVQRNLYKIQEGEYKKKHSHYKQSLQVITVKRKGKNTIITVILLLVGYLYDRYATAQEDLRISTRSFFVFSLKIHLHETIASVHQNLHFRGSLRSDAFWMVVSMGWTSGSLNFSSRDPKDHLSVSVGPNQRTLRELGVYPIW